MTEQTSGLVGSLLDLPLFHAEWVLWLLLLLSLGSVGVMVERWWFYRRHRIEADVVRRKLNSLLDDSDFSGAAQYLSSFDSLETNVVLFGLRDYAKGPDSVEDLVSGAMRVEKARYDKWLNFLATVASNAPFIGLFGTVLGIIRVFKELSGNMAEASDAVMGGIAEALIATAVGLLVAIPAVIAFNIFKSRVKLVVDNAHLLARTLLARLKAEDFSVQG